MYGIYTYIWLFFMVNVAKYTIHGYYGYSISYTIFFPQCVLLALLVLKFVVEFWHVSLSLIQNIYIYNMYRKGIPGLHEPQATGTNPEISSWMISFC